MESEREEAGRRIEVVARILADMGSDPRSDEATLEDLDWVLDYLIRVGAAAGMTIPELEMAAGRSLARIRQILWDRKELSERQEPGEP